MKHFHNWAEESQQKKSIWAEESRAEMVFGRGVPEPRKTRVAEALLTFSFIWSIHVFLKQFTKGYFRLKNSTKIFD